MPPMRDCPRCGHKQIMEFPKPKGRIMGRFYGCPCAPTPEEGTSG